MRFAPLSPKMLPRESLQVAAVKGIFCVIVPQDPRNSTLYFTARTRKGVARAKTGASLRLLADPGANVAIDFKLSKGG
jgi:hypothetical protein